MDWTIFYTVFISIFLAELADKTQVLTMTFAATHNRAILSVLLGSSLALLLSTIIGVLCGKVISRFISTDYIYNGAAVLFIAVGILMLFKKI